MKSKLILTRSPFRQLPARILAQNADRLGAHAARHPEFGAGLAEPPPPCNRQAAAPKRRGRHAAWQHDHAGFATPSRTGNGLRTALRSPVVPGVWGAFVASTRITPPA